MNTYTDDEAAKRIAELRSQLIVQGKDVGFGDALAAGIQAVGGPKPCGGCQRRKEAMNAVTPSWARRLLGRLFRR